LERLLAPIGVDEVKITLIDSLTAQKRLVQAGFGLALVPESSVRDEPQTRQLEGTRDSGDARQHPGRVDSSP